MPIIIIPTYEVRCDGLPQLGKPIGIIGIDSCSVSEGCQLSRQELAEDLESAGWLKKGWKWYCPACRKQFDKKG